jgi:hypothetical protein
MRPGQIFCTWARTWKLDLFTNQTTADILFHCRYFKDCDGSNLFVHEFGHGYFFFFTNDTKANSWFVNPTTINFFVTNTTVIIFCLWLRPRGNFIHECRSGEFLVDSCSSELNEAKQRDRTSCLLNRHKNTTNEHLHLLTSRSYFRIIFCMWSTVFIN